MSQPCLHCKEKIERRNFNVDVRPSATGSSRIMYQPARTSTSLPWTAEFILLVLKSEWMSEVGFEKQYFQGRGDEKWHVQCFFLEVFIIGTWASWRISFSLMTYMVFRKPSFKKVRSMKTKDRAVVFQMFVTKANFSVFDSLMYFSEKRAQTIKEK